jgi:segregation and condensation protein A
MLLPAPPPGQEDEVAPEDEGDPREALIRRLLEYQKYKHAGEQLATRGIAGRDVFGRGMPVEEAETQGLPPLAEIPMFSLVEAFQRVLDRSKVKLSHDIVADRISLSDRIGQLSIASDSSPTFWQSGGGCASTSSSKTCPRASTSS